MFLTFLSILFPFFASFDAGDYQIENRFLSGLWQMRPSLLANLISPYDNDMLQMSHPMILTVIY